ncbi:hypothetical protein [Deinococcus cellulosilyticus]|uniref:Uncharacterized protein n=1 Tax=Deinococcus cellulosilyticus (strain DSM 18568 / NBRC 106333 / KACC 11606 / 5516J-15) TaxID=1223518 RepID=A0A511MZQ1_DEIC1|nr:hypothetical protein [Deinococcus cellulosilyticus]GEM45596.1 hypothetical protein DC3_12310 [Deinococcus cellulosilyticus NBRC 106333 = KACC 11606]
MDCAFRWVVVFWLVASGVAQAVHVLESHEDLEVTSSKVLSIEIRPARQLNPDSTFYKITASILMDSAKADGFLCTQDMELMWYSTRSGVPQQAYSELFTHLRTAGWKVKFVGTAGPRVHYLFTRNTAVVYAALFNPNLVQKHNDVYDLLWCKARRS